GDEAEYRKLLRGPINGTTMKPERALIEKVTTLENVCWKELWLLVFVWIAFFGLQIAKVPIDAKAKGRHVFRLVMQFFHTGKYTQESG
ncbi:hypothetical protein Tco_1350828, partial [Tanacetum coccineum]